MQEEQKELIKAGADAAMKPFANLIEKLFGGSVEEIGGMWQDTLKVRRFERQIKLFAKVQQLIHEAGFEPRRVNDSVSIPLMNAATLEDDERLQQKWACLLANAAKPNSPIHPGFVQILSNMAALDAVVLDEMYKRLLSGLRDKGNIQIVYLDNDGANDVLRVVKEAGGDVAVENVVRLGLLLADPEHPGETTLSGGLKVRPTYRYYITQFGLDFYIACQPPPSQEALLRRK